MQFVAKVVLSVLFGPLGIDVLLRTLVRFPAQWHRAFLDHLGFLTLVALDRSVHERSVDDLAATGQIPLRQQLRLDLLEYLIAYAGLGQAVTEQPDCFRILNATAVGQIQEAQEAAAVQQLILQRVIGQVVELLQYQDLDHQDRRIRRSATFGARWTRGGCIDPCGQRVKIHVLGQADQRIAYL